MDNMDIWLHGVIYDAVFSAKVMLGDYLQALSDNPLVVMAATIAVITLLQLIIKTIRRILHV